LVKVSADSARATEASETMLLKKTGADWRVMVRHVEREATSGEWSSDKCEPTDAPARLPIYADIQALAGEFNIARVGASRSFRGRSDVVRIRLEPLKPSAGRPNEFVSRATVIDARGEPQHNIAATFELGSDGAVITFSQRLPENVIQTDGWMEQYKILRTDGRGFFGTWFTVTGPTVPSQGYFCARPR